MQDHLPSQFLEDMLLRTAVLLRFSTGATRDLIGASVLNDDDVALWRDALGISRGLWTAGDEIDVLDLWEDTAMALEDLDAADVSGAHAFLMGLGGSAITLGQAERVVAWSFAS